MMAFKQIRWLLLGVILGTAGCPGSSSKTDPNDGGGSDNRSVVEGKAETNSPPAQNQNAKGGRLAAARQKGAAGDFSGAMQLLREHLVAAPNDSNAFAIGADLAMRSGDLPTAIDYLEKFIEGKPDAPLGMRDQLAQLWMRVGRPFESIRVLENAIVRFPNAAEPHFDLAGLAAMLGLEEPAIKSLIWLAQHNQGHEEGLVLLTHPSRLEPDVEICKDALRKAPDDQRAGYGLARMDAFAQRWDLAAERLERIVERHPEFVAASALLGRSLVELNEASRVEAWHASVPKSLFESSIYWDAAGRWAIRQGQPRAAAKAFWQAVRLDQANDDATLVSLATSLQRCGKRELAAQAADRAKQIASLRDATRTFFERGSQSQSAAMLVARRMQAVGRIWEAEGWARWALRLPDQKLVDAREQYSSIRSALTPQTPWQSPASMIAGSMDLSDFPDVAWDTRQDQAAPAGSGLQPTGQIQFQELAKERGLNHTCELAEETQSEGMWIFHSVGGGAGVIDFDLDGWPDLSYAMLDGKPLKEDSQPNHLFRNLGGRFNDVTASSALDDRGFSQGIAVGDVNADGFPDLLDANIGTNRLLINNGDGTFRDATQASGLAAPGLASAAWTSSAVIVDLNGDAIADLWEVNYCSGPEPYQKECRSSGGKIASCTPLDFRAQSDRIWAGRGDGTFVEMSDEWLPDHDAGRGLGLIVGELDQRPGIDVYIANDMTRNQFWSGAGTERNFTLSDMATIAGVAVNSRSISQASMGMAAADADNDGDLDFLLTHFSDDHNTYYEQVSSGLWQDRSYPSGLGRPSEPLLGFGTEWVDLDNNGSVELIIANGHVSDLRTRNIPYQMPSQVFQREPQGTWREIERAGLGPYFQREHLGRALVTLDADRDGRVDCSITQIHEPVALLMNRSVSDSRAIGLFLIARERHRDAIGSVVSATVGNRVHVAQCLAGDGYMCSNQRRISIGVGDQAEASKVSVRWSPTQIETFGSLQAGKDYLLIEGSGDAFELGTHR